jgi:hypothetical protein
MVKRQAVWESPTAPGARSSVPTTVGHAGGFRIEPRQHRRAITSVLDDVDRHRGRILQGQRLDQAWRSDFDDRGRHGSQVLS